MKTQRKEVIQVCQLSAAIVLSSEILQTCIIVVDGQGQQPPPPNRPPQAESFGDSSGPLFSIYSKYVEEEDNKVTDRWQKDADGILIFMSSPHGIDIFFSYDYKTGTP
jgi:hypothetical protein